MSHQFESGDKVTVREGATSIFGHKRDPKEVRRVVTGNNPWGNVVLERTGKPGNVWRPEDLVPVPVGKGLKNGDKVIIRSIPGLAPDHKDIGRVVELWGRRVANDGRILFTAGGWGLYEEDVDLAADPSKVKAGDTVTLSVDPVGSVTTPKPFEVTGEAWEDYSDNPHGPLLRVGTYWLNSPEVAVIDHQPAPEPEPATPAPGTFGTAVVDGQRRHGLIDEDGDFAFQVWDSAYRTYAGDQFANSKQFTDFKPYSEDE